jgi:signal transduction histidine kinase
MAWLAVIALLVVRLLASIQDVPSGATIRDGPDGLYVADVQVGSLAWFLGITPGHTYTPSADGGGGLVVGTERDVELPETLPPYPWWPLVAAMAALVVALVSHAAAPSLAVVAMVGATTLLLWELVGAIVMPLALAVVAVPTLVLGMRWLMVAPRGRPRVAFAAAILGAIALEAGALATATRDTWRAVWGGATVIPAVLAIAVAGIMWAIAVRRSLAGVDATSRSFANAMVATTTAGRVALWSASERSRDERARWVHDTVLPRLSTGIREIDSGHEATGSGVLSRLVDDLRAGLEQEQLTVLRAGGMGAALNDALEEARAEGFACDLSIDGTDARPPWPVVVAAWRVAQEAIANARQHSGGDRIAVTLVMGDDRLVLDVSDDGVGLDHEALARRRGHIGMQAMARAAEAVGAAVRFMPATPRGLTVRFGWPP